MSAITARTELSQPKFSNAWRNEATNRVLSIVDLCAKPIEPGERYELSVYPPHRVEYMDVPRWLVWRTHFPRHDGGRFLPGCDLAAAYREKAVRAQLGEDGDRDR